MKVFEVFLYDGACCMCSCVSKSVDDTIVFLESELNNYEVGSQVKIVVKEMSEKELAELPEWDGP